MKMHPCVGILLAFVLASCAQNEAPLTDNEAARRAAQCFNWPEVILDDVSTLQPAGPVPDGGVVLAFRNAASVYVTPDGECRGAAPTRVASNLLRHLPQNSFTPVDNLSAEQNGIYVLLLSRTEENGDRFFVGMKGGGAAFRIIPGRDA